MQNSLKNPEKFLKALILSEMIVVIIIIFILLIISVVSLLKTRGYVEEQLTTASLRTIVSAQFQWRASHSTYTSLANLYNDALPYIDSTLATGSKQGYIFTSHAVTGSERSQFIATAEPQALTQAYTFYIDENGLLCKSNSPNTYAPTDHVDKGCPSGFSPAK